VFAHRRRFEKGHCCYQLTTGFRAIVARPEGYRYGFFTVSGEAFATGVGVPGATGRFAHLDGDGVRVDDVGAFYEELPGDVETVSEPQTTESGATICFVQDPDGNLIEVIEA